MHVSYAELNRIAPEVLRMMGVPFGHADDAVECFVWTEAVFSRGYQLVQMGEDSPVPAWPIPEVQRVEPKLEVRLKGSPLLLYAARLCDLALADFFPALGLDHVRIIGGFGGWVAPYMVHRLARSGNPALISWISSDSCEPHKTPTAIAAASANGGELWFVSMDSLPSTQIFCLLKGGLGNGELRVVRLPANTSPQAALRRFCDESGFPPKNIGRVDNSDRLKKVIAHGMERNADQHRAIVKMAARVRVPASERSRAQAG